MNAELRGLRARTLDAEGNPLGAWVSLECKAAITVRPPLPESDSAGPPTMSPLITGWLNIPLDLSPTGPAHHRDTWFLLTCLPFFYRPARPELPAGRSAARQALPWGDSAYTSFTPACWLPGDPPPEPGWCLGPPANGLTPSSEGPRRAAAAAEQMVTRLLGQPRWGLRC